jgi:hypothetical protein
MGVVHVREEVKILILHRAEIPGLKAATCDNLLITCGVSVSPKLGAYRNPEISPESLLFSFLFLSFLFPEDEGFDCVISDPLTPHLRLISACDLRAYLRD